MEPLRTTCSGIVSEPFEPGSSRDVEGTGDEQNTGVIYTRDWCSYCQHAKRLLKRKGYAFEEINMTSNPEGRAWLARITGRDTVPQVFVEDRPIGGFHDVKALNRSGELDRLVRVG